MTLRKKTFSALRWTTSASVFRILIKLSQVAILARLLEKEDFGLLAMAMVLVEFASIFSGLGLNTAFLQKRDVTDNERSSLYSFNILISTLFAVLTCAAGYIFAQYVYGEPRLTLVTICISPLFIINALGAQVRVSAEKDLNFKRITNIDLFAGLLGLALAVLIAKMGGGVYALVSSSLVTATVSSALYWVFLSNGFSPSWRLNFAELRRFFGFGGAVVANNLVSQVNLSADIFLGARVLGAAQLGLYSVPRNLVLQIQYTISPVVTRVGFPLIARLQDDAQKVREVFSKISLAIISIVAPLYVGLAFYGTEVAGILLGQNWEKSGHLLRVIAIVGGLRSFSFPVESLLLGMGRADLQLKWSLVVMAVTPLTLLCGFYASAHYGWCDSLDGMVYAMLILAVLAYVPVWRLLIHPLCNITLRQYAASTLKPYAISLAAISPSYLIYKIYGMQAAPAFIAAIIFSVISYIFLSVKFNRSTVESMKEFLVGEMSGSSKEKIKHETVAGQKEGTPYQSNKPVISVILPVYNVEAYLEPCLESLRHQTFSNIEIICVNDVSTDGSLEVLKAAAQKDERIKIISLATNKGCGGARNEGVKTALGSWILFIDPDDVVSETLCERTLAAAHAQHADVVFYDFCAFNDGAAIPRGLVQGPPIALNREQLLERNAFAWTKLVSAALLREKQISFPENFLMQDTLAHWRLVLEAKNPIFLNEKLVYYRQRISAASFQVSRSRMNGIIMYDMVEKYLKESNAWDAYCSLLEKKQIVMYTDVCSSFAARPDLEAEAIAEVRKRITAQHWAQILHNNSIATWRRDYLAARCRPDHARATPAIYVPVLRYHLRKLLKKYLSRRPFKSKN